MKRPTVRIVFWSLIGVVAVVVAAGIFVAAVNLVIVHDARPFIASSATSAPSASVAIVLGAGFHPDGTPSPMMADRLDTALSLYRSGKVRALLLSGDSRPGNDQVSLMVRYVVAQGVPKKDLITDGSGLTTYQTMLRARTVFHVESALVPTQRFHLARSVYLARSLGLQATGVPAEIRQYSTISENVREWAARVKAFLQIHF